MFTKSTRLAYGVMLLSSAFVLAACGGGGSGGSSAPDTTAPIVTGSSPANGNSETLTNSQITVSFSEPLDSSSIDATTVTMTHDNLLINIPGTVSYDPVTYTIVFTPNWQLETVTPYTLTITTDIKDPAGNHLAAAATLSFTTEPHIRRASLASDGTEGNVSVSESVGLSADGRYVVFATGSDNLVANDTNMRADIFVRDVQTGTTIRANLAANGDEANNSSRYPGISGNGRVVAFTSDASNLVTDDSNNVSDVFVRDVQNNTTERVSIANDGSEANAGSKSSALSEDGRFVAFDSAASNLVANDTNGRADVFVRDRQLNTTLRVSVATDGTEANEASNVTDISTDGRYVVFVSRANNLVAGDTNNTFDVFVRDLQMNTTTRVSVASDGSEAAGLSSEGKISANGRYVVFISRANNLVAGDSNGAADIFVHDIQTGETTRVSTGYSGEEANGPSYSPSISGDGRYVAFSSDATNLFFTDSNNTIDVYVHDRQATFGPTIRISVGPFGAVTDGFSDVAAISVDGHYVAFVSNATNLVTDDGNGVQDIFRAVNTYPYPL